MAISVNTVYRTVLLIINKEQRGYLENKPGPGLNILPNGNIFAAKVNRQKLTGKI